MCIGTRVDLFSKAYRVTNKIEMTSKMNAATDKILRYVVVPKLRIFLLKKISWSSSNGWDMLERTWNVQLNFFLSGDE